MPEVEFQVTLNKTYNRTLDGHGRLIIDKTHYCLLLHAGPLLDCGSV